MKILITGGNGMLGKTLQRELAPNEIIAADLPQWDILGEEFAERVAEVKPELIIHCAAMTNVDGCESNRDAAFRLNEDGSRNVALAAKMCGARLIAISTDFVFSGEPPREPWAWSENDMPRPQTVYGMSKFAGETMVSMIYPEAVILRTGWLYGEDGRGFVNTMLRLGREAGPALRIVDDQRGNPTSCKALSDVIKFLISKPSVAGIVHGTCENQCSRYELACEIKRLCPYFVREIKPCTSDEFNAPAKRPRNSALKKSVLNLLGYRTPDWKTDLERFINSVIQTKENHE